MKKSIYITFFIFFLFNSVFSQSDSIKILIEKTNELNLDMWDLTTFAEENIKDKKELARFFYYWIVTNIQYDDETLKEKDEERISLEEYSNRQDEYEVYKNKKGVCAGYSNLFKWFMNEVEIEVVTISGHIRDERNHFIALNDKDFKHAWNAIKLNGKWILIDTTWGTSNNKETSEFYFDIKPEYLIITHYPNDSKWQLLKEPLTLEQFNNSQFVRPIWFMVGFTEIPKLMTDEEFYYFTFQDLPDNKWSVSLTMSTDNSSFEPINDIRVIEKDGRTYFQFGKTQVPKKAYFKVKIGKIENVEDGFIKTEYGDVINFKL